MLAGLGETMLDYRGIPDERLRQRLKMIVEAFLRQPNESIPQACGSVEATKGAYRFLDNKRVSQAAIVSGQREATWERIQASGDGVVQDTTSFDFSSHRQTSGLGMLENVYTRGLLVHTSLAVSEQGMPWGLLEQQVWVRPPEEVGKSKTRKQRTIDDKESIKWLKGLPLVPEVVSAAGQQVVIVAHKGRYLTKGRESARAIPPNPNPSPRKEGKGAIPESACVRAYFRNNVKYLPL